MAIDDAARMVGVIGVHRNPDLADAVDRQREDGMRNIRRHDEQEAVGLEQPAHDARLDVGVRLKDDDEITHEIQSQQ